MIADRRTSMQGTIAAGGPDDPLDALEAALADVRALAGLLTERRVAAARRRLTDVHVRAAAARRAGSVRRP